MNSYGSSLDAHIPLQASILDNVGYNMLAIYVTGWRFLLIFSSNVETISVKVLQWGPDCDSLYCECWAWLV